MFEKFDEINRLLDFYGGLLTKIQHEYMVLYYRYDYSLTEIADEHGITKQAVSENLKRAEQNLYQYEDTLALVKRFYDTKKRIMQTIDELNGIASQVKDADVQRQIATVIEALQVLSD